VPRADRQRHPITVVYEGHTPGGGDAVAVTGGGSADAPKRSSAK